MGEFHEAVSTLLGFFAEGISNIKTQKERRSKQKLASEERLQRSLKRSKNEVKSRYDKDLERFGERFAAGDAESRSSLAIILSRLASGILSIITRLSKGKSTASDYQTLVSLSDVTRKETLRTFDQLSYRLSTSSLALIPQKAPGERHRSSRKPTSKVSNSNSRSHTRAKSVPNLSVTPLGPATDSGWIRPKAKKHSSKSKSLSSINSRKQHLLEAPPAPQQDPPVLIPPSSFSMTHPIPSLNNPNPPKSYHRPSPRRAQTSPEPLPKCNHSPPPFQRNRKSFMSFASDSTKLGEIPEHKWSHPAAFDNDGLGEKKWNITAFYPLGTVPEPVKPKSKLRRLFGRT